MKELMKEALVEHLQLGQTVDGIYVLRSSKLIPLRDGSGNYLAAVLGDRTGQVQGRSWESAGEIYGSCRVGDIVRVQGLVTEYKGHKQIQISAMAVHREENIDLSRFIPSSKLDPETARTQLASLFDTMENKHLKALFSLITADKAFFPAFVTAPAARRNHHAAIGGLLEHSLGVATAAAQLTTAYPELDRDLLVAGALLHDIGKVEEYRLSTDINFTDQGRLLGHIILGVQILEKYLNQLTGFPEDLRFKLLHMIVSHHGRYEWQSPKRPKFLEAAILHHLDMIDMEADVFSSAVDARADSEERWTGWIKGLERYLFCK